MNLDPGTIVNGLIVAALVGLAADHFRIRQDLAAALLSQEKIRTYVVENFVRQPEIQRLEESVTRVSNTLDELVKLVHELKGQINRG